jgi:hypothetical protein
MKSYFLAQKQVGGVVFPIMLRRLFATVGFAWGIRIAGFVCLACCVVATLTVTSRLSTSKPDSHDHVPSFKDAPFILLAIGSTLVFIGIILFSIVIPLKSHLDIIL